MAMGLPSLSLLLLLSLMAITLRTGLSQGNRYITWDDINLDQNRASALYTIDHRARTRVIVVRKDGKGHSTTVQGAINMVPDGNKRRVKILVHSGVYREKVTIPISKPHISLIGTGKKPPVISWNSKASDRDPTTGHELGTFFSATFAVDSDYFVANRITFENTSPGAVPGSVGKQAVALRLSGDKAVLYRCRILGTQDTLFDHMGRHYFHQCHIEGSIDFIFGNARSLYQGCILHVTASYYGAIAAQQRNSPNDKSGFSFVNCRITGSGQAVLLGRAWGRYASIVYAYCKMDNIIAPEGWYDWNDPSRRSTVLMAEYNCEGPGSSPRPRVPWEKSLTYEEARIFLGQNYIDGNQWLRL